MEILLNGLGPNDSITCDGMVYRNGDTVILEDEFAAAYIGAKLAVAAQPSEVDALRRLETNNKARRGSIQNESEKEAG